MVETPAVASDQASIPAGEALLQVLRLHGVKAIFSSPGSEWPALWEALAAPAPQNDTPIRYFNIRHESLAAATAIGYHKATGELVAVVLHSRVGPLQGAMAIQVAAGDAVPMVVLSGDSSTWGMDPAFDPGSQWLHSLAGTGGPARAIGAVVKWSEQVGNPWQLGEMLRHACRTALATPSGPTFLSVPLEVLLGRIPTSTLPRLPAPKPDYAPHPAALDRFAEALLSARQPVIITEEAGRNPESVGRLVALAETLGAAVVEAQRGGFVNFPTEHSLHQGYQAAPVIADADVVLLLGTRGPWHPPRLPMAAEARILLADENSGKLDRPIWPYEVDDYCHGDLLSTITGLLERVQSAGIAGAKAQALRAKWSERHEQLRGTWQAEAEAVRDRRPIDPRWLCREIGQILPDDAILTQETTTTRSLIQRYVPRVRPGSYAIRMGSGIGVGLGIALGLKVAHPDRPVIAVVGDGTFNYNPVAPALGFMQEYGTPILTIIVNNGSYASMKQTHQKYYPDGWGARSGRWLGAPLRPLPEYSAFATAFGGYGERVERPDGIRPAFQRALAATRDGKPAILDVIVDE